MPTDSTAESVPNPPAEQRDLPPLRIHHLLALMTVTALWLFPGGTGGLKIETWWIVTSLPSILGATMAVTCCGFGLWWRRQGMAFPNEPGHWLIISYCIAILCSILFQILYSQCAHVEANVINLREPEVLTRWFFDWGWHISAVPVILLSLWIARRLASSRRWMLLFVLIAIFETVHVLDGLVVSRLLTFVLEPLGTLAFPLHFGIGFFTDARQLVPTVALCWACWRDHRDGIPRHWSHWCGVIAWILALPGAIAVAYMNMGWISYPWD